MKTCVACDFDKPFAEFGKLKRSPDGRSSKCLLCTRDYNRSYYATNKSVERPKRTERSLAARRDAVRFVRDYLVAHPCVDCGESDWVVLDFDHVRGSKRRNVSDLAWGGASIQTLEAEIDKCEVRCANCHRRVTWRRKQALLGL